ncbi:MAG: hypothetical protein ACR2GY_02780 [Phycisphaerales bacterium]
MPIKLPMTKHTTIATTARWRTRSGGLPAANPRATAMAKAAQAQLPAMTWEGMPLTNRASNFVARA